MRTKKVTTGETKPSGFATNRQRVDALAATAASMSMWKPAREALIEVRSVRTIFPQLDALTRVLGWPIDRVGVIHGPSNDGKTVLAHGLGLSFLKAGHFYAYIDAEQTTPISWVRKLMQGFEANPAFIAMRPRNYEEAVDATREFCSMVRDGKASGKLPADTSGILIVDSLRKLNPKGMLDKLLKEGSTPDAKPKGRRKGAPVGVDGMGGRAGQIKAAMNASWLDELIPLAADAGVAIVLVARETDDSDAGMFSRIDFKVGGGKAVNYDASIRVRVVKVGTVRDSADGPVVGERHRVELHKTKVAEREEQIPCAFFHTSNGTHAPTGFDPCRDLLEIAADMGVVELKGSWYQWGAIKLGNGTAAAIAKLRENTDGIFDDLNEEVRGWFKDARSEPQKVADDGTH